MIPASTLDSPELREIIARGLSGRVERPASVLVLGAGMAGLVAAHELERAGHRVTVLEARHRVGGRVFTVREPFSQGQYAEAGAMRIPANHRLVLDYIRKFGLKVRPFTSTNPKAFAYFHGRRHRLGRALAESSHLGFPLTAEEAALGFDGLWKRVMRPLTDELEAGGAEAWAEVEARLQCVSLRDYLICQGWSRGAVEMYGLFAGFETLLYASAFEFVREFVTELRRSTLSIVGGFDQLPHALADTLRKPIELGAQVTSLGQDKNGVVVRVTGLRGPRELRADYAICTLPLSILRHIEIDQPASFSWDKQLALRNIHYETAAKIFFESNERFWETQDGIYGGSSVTDLAVRNLYYPEHGRETGRGVLIGSYCHGQDALRWGALSPEQRLVQALENVSEIHPSATRHVEVGTSIIWAHDPFAGGAYAFFQPHQESLLHEAICRPEGRIYFAGEHASRQHRWIQGAIDSALRAVRDLHATTLSSPVILEANAMASPTDSTQAPQILTDMDVRRSVACDFGGVVQHLPLGVVRPRSLEEVVSAVRYARARGLPIAARGVGHSAGGQSQVADGLVIDMTSMNTIHEVDLAGRTFVADAGIRWRKIMDTLVPMGLTPPVVTDWLHLTLAGTIVAGGVGAHTFKHGIQADLIESMTIVTGTGEVLTCSADAHPDLFDATRAGLGQYGIIVRATMRLDAAPERVTLDHLVYDDLAAFTADVDRLSQVEHIDGLLAHAVGNTLALISASVGRDLTVSMQRSPVSGKWVYDLEVSRYHPDGHSPKPLPRGLRHIEALSHSQLYTFADYISRVPPIVERDSRKGAAPHPELTLFVPDSQAPSFMGSVMAETEIEDMGGGPVLIIPIRRPAIRAPFFRIPDEPRSWLFGLLRATDTSEKTRRLSERNVELYHRAVAVGAFRYPCDGVRAPTTRAGWATHFGPVWERAVAAKLRYDPDGLINPTLGVFRAT